MRKTTQALLMGFTILITVVLARGLFVLDEGELAVVIEYGSHEVIWTPLGKLLEGDVGGFRSDFVAFIYGLHSGGEVKPVRYGDPAFLDISATFGKLYWHLPPPFGKHYKIEQVIYDFKLTIPLINPILGDLENRPLLSEYLTPDVDGDPSTIDIGFHLISAHDVFETRFSPETEFPAYYLTVNGQFTVSNEPMYVMWVKNSYGQMDELIQQNGFYSEIIYGPFADKLVAIYISEVFQTYLWRVRLPELAEAAHILYPELDQAEIKTFVANEITKNPEILIEGFTVFLSSPEYYEVYGVSLEHLTGISIKDEIYVEIYEGTL